MTLIAISHYIEAKFDYGYFIMFLCCGFLIFLNFLSKFKVQGLDIVTLMGAKGPQKGLKGPRDPKAPPALHRN